MSLSKSVLKLIRIITIAGAGGIALLLALLIYPHDYPQQPITDVAGVRFDTTQPFKFGMEASSLVLMVSPTSANGTHFTTYGPPTPYNVGVTVPIGAWRATAECGKQKFEFCTLDKSTQTISAEFPSAPEPLGPALRSDFSVPQVDGKGGYPVTQSGAYASIQLPGVDLQDSTWTYDSPNPGANIPVVTRIHFPHWKKYSWSGGPAPGDGPTADDMSFLEVTDATGTIPAVIESGVMQQKLHTDSTLTLLSGALVGLVGAAVIALLQEIKKEKE